MPTTILDKDYYNKIRTKLEALAYKKKIKTPLGIEQYFIPQTEAHKLGLGLEEPGRIAATIGSTPPLSIFEQESINPRNKELYHEALTHEPIHAGQMQLKDSGTFDTYAEALNKEKAKIYYNNPADNFDLMPTIGEATAYGFSDYNPKNQNAVNVYLDMLAKLNPQGTQTLEAALPNEFLKEYIKTRPRPYVAQPPKNLKSIIK